MDGAGEAEAAQSPAPAEIARCGRNSGGNSGGGGGEDDPQDLSASVAGCASAVGDNKQGEEEVEPESPSSPINQDQRPVPVVDRLPRTPLHISEDPSSDGLFSPAVAVVRQPPAVPPVHVGLANALAGGNGGDARGGPSDDAGGGSGGMNGTGDNENEALGSAGDQATGQHKWMCDACRIVGFSSYEEACRHEETCTGPPPPAADAAPAGPPAANAAATATADTGGATVTDPSVPANVDASAIAPVLVPGAPVAGMGAAAGLALGAGVAGALPPGIAVYGPGCYPPPHPMHVTMNVPAFPPAPSSLVANTAANGPALQYAAAAAVAQTQPTNNALPTMVTTASFAGGVGAGSVPFPGEGADPTAQAYLRHQQAILRSQETRDLVGHSAPPMNFHAAVPPDGGLGVASAPLYPAASLPPPETTGSNDYVAVVKPTAAAPTPVAPTPAGVATAISGIGAAVAMSGTVPVPMEGHSIVEVYVCDVCRVAQFDTYEEACRHEEKCDGGVPGAGSGTNVADASNPFADADADADDSADIGVVATRSPGPGGASANGSSGRVGTDTNVSEPIAEAKEDDDHDDGVAAFLRSSTSSKPTSPAKDDLATETSYEKDQLKPKEAVAAIGGTSGTKRKLDQADMLVAETSAPATKSVLDSDKNTPLQLDRPLSELPRRKNPRPPTQFQCGSCDFCMVDSCGTCKACLDMPRFGGSGTLKRKCYFRPSCPNKPTPKRSHTNHEPALVSKEIATGAPTTSTANTAAIADEDNEGPSNDSDQLWTFVAIDGHRFERMRGYKKRIPQVLVVWKGGEKTWEPAKNVKEDDPVTFFRYVDKIGLEEQSEEDSKSKLGGKTAWRKILKDGRPPMIEG